MHPIERPNGQIDQLGRLTRKGNACSHTSAALLVWSRDRDVWEREDVPLPFRGTAWCATPRAYATCFARLASLSSFLTCSMISFNSDSGTHENALSVGSSSIFSAICQEPVPL